HEERIFLGLALLHRYKNSRAGSQFEPLFRILSEEALQQAEVLGKAMRFGAMFSAEALDEMGSLKWAPKKKQLELLLHPGAEPLFGEVAAARFQSLAKAMGAEEVIVKVKD
ncbi:MAG: exopolyphosphatase, partial [Paracoccaceae bacterium]|nr:exopolyphosphatase [Paracoccaceae bacterium]